MFIKGIETNDFDNLIIEVDKLLSKSENFTSPTYQLKELKSINDLWILVKPEQKEFVELLKPLNLKWLDVELKLNEL